MFEEMKNFNSIKVRLEPRSSSRIAGAGRFQFHKGTIRTGCIGVMAAFYTYFNSIKVRLEHKDAQIAELNENPFQFHKGTIRTKNTTYSSKGISHFNSIKVRLEPVKSWL